MGEDGKSVSRLLKERSWSEVTLLSPIILKYVAEPKNDTNT
jgi:hypothetical protein